MKKTLLPLLMLLISTVCLSQQPAQISAKRVSAYEMLTLREKRVDSLSTDTALANNSNTVISTTRAIKTYIDKRIGATTGFWDSTTVYQILSGKANQTALQDSIFAVRQAIATGGATINFYATNLADLKTKNGVNGSYAVTLGYYNTGDGGTGQYRWDAASTETPDDALIIQANGSATGRWKLIVNNGIISLGQFGAVGDNSNRLAEFTKAVQAAALRDFAITGSGTVNLNNGSVTVNGNLNIVANNNLVIRNGSYIHVTGNIKSRGVEYRKFSTAVFYYPTGMVPAQDVTHTIERNIFDTCYYAVNNQSSWPVGREWVNSSFSYNTIKNVWRGVLNPKSDQINFTVHGNVADGVYQDGSEYRNLFVLGGNGTINVENFSKNISVMYNKIYRIVYPQANGSVSNQVIAVDGASVNISFNEMYEVKAQNIYFAAEDAICEGNILINDTTLGAEQAIIAKNGSYIGTAKVHKNVIRGYFTTGIYYDSKTKYAEITDNNINIKGTAATTGDCAIRYQNYGPMESIKVTGNIINQDQPNVNIVGIQIGSLYRVEKTYVEGNEINTRTKGLQIYGPTAAGVQVFVKNNKIRSRVQNTIYGDYLTINDNDLFYPVDTNTSFLTVGAKVRGVFRDNEFRKDTITPTSFVAQLINIPTVASRKGASYYFYNNLIDPSRASNVIGVENPVSLIAVDGDRLMDNYTGAYLRYYSASEGVNVDINDLRSYSTTGTFIQTTTADTANIDVVLSNSTVLNNTVFINSNNSKRRKLIIDNTELAATPALLRGWTTYVNRPKGAGNATTTTVNKSLAYGDVRGGQTNYLLVNSTSSRTITIPDTSTVLLPLNTPVRIIQANTGSVSVAASGAVVLSSNNGILTTKRQFHAIDLVQTSYNNWIAFTLFDTTGLTGGGGGGGGVADNWGTQVVITDSSLKNNGTSPSPLGVNQNVIASKKYVEQYFEDSASSFLSDDPYQGFSGANTLDSPIVTNANVKSTETTTVVGQLVQYNSTNGKQVGKYTGTGFPKLNNGIPTTQAFINLTSDVTGLLGLDKLNATGTRSSTTFLRGDGQWAVPPGGTGSYDPGANGFVVRTAENVFTARTFVFSSDFTTSNLDGVSGNPNIALASNVARIGTAQTWTATQNFSSITNSGGATFGATSWDNANFNIESGGGRATTQTNFKNPSATGVQLRWSSRGSSTSALTANYDYFSGVIGRNNISKAGSGTHGRIGQLYVANGNATGTAATGLASLLYLEDGNLGSASSDTFSVYAEGKIRTERIKLNNLFGGGKIRANEIGEIVKVTNPDGDPDEYFDMIRKGVVNTSNTTATSVLIVGLPDNTFGTVQFDVIGTDGNNATCAYRRILRYKRVNTVLTILSEQTIGTDFKESGTASTNINVTVQPITNNLMINVIGNSFNMNWRCSAGAIVYNLTALP
jgi:hypothetical protein